MDVAGLRKRLSTVLDKPLETSPTCDPRGPVFQDAGLRASGRKLKMHVEGTEQSMSRSVSTSSEHSNSSLTTSSSEEGVDGVDATDEATTSRAHSSPSPIRTRLSADGEVFSAPSDVYSERPRPRPAQRRKTTLRPQSSAPSQASTRLGLSISMIVALVSPLGNLLTGGDHIKNFLLLLLLIYYLNQLIEVPWSLYCSTVISEDEATYKKDDSSHKARAISELRTLELFYLSLTVFSPFIGASLLKFVAVAITDDPNTLSWFSMSLFVLATGLRPWSHLVDRLKDRSHALRTIIEESDDEPLHSDPSLQTEKGDEEHEKTKRELLALKRQMQAFEKRLSAMNTAHSQEWDDMADSIVGVESEGRRFNRDNTCRADVCDQRMEVLETCIRGLQEHALRVQRKEGSNTIIHRTGVLGCMWSVIALPWTLTNFCWRTVWEAVSRPLEIMIGREKAISQKVDLDQPLLGPLTTIIEEPELQLQDPPVPMSSFTTDASDDTIVAMPFEERQMTSHSKYRGLIVTASTDIPNFLFHPISFFLFVSALIISIPRRIIRLAASGA